MHHHLLGALAGTALLLAGCASSDDRVGGAMVGPTGDERVWPGGQKLSDYKDSPTKTYEWRVNIMDNQSVILERLQRTGDWLDDGDFNDLLETCNDIRNGVDGAKVVANAVVRLSGGPDEQATKSDAAAVVTLAKKYACP